MADDIDTRRVEYLPLDDITGAPRNPKRHHTDGLRASIGRFGFATPALRDERTGRLVVGHGRTEALRAMRGAGETAPAGVRVDDEGRWLVPVVCGWASRSDAEAEAYLVADNRHTELGGWDHSELADLLVDVQAFDPDLVDIAGWDLADLEELLAEPTTTELPPALPAPDVAPEPPAVPVTKPGDVWLLGPHRIICGDSRDYDTVEKLLDGVRVNVAFTSPPYASQRKYDESSGFRPIPPDEYVDWFEDIQANVRAVLAEDGSWFVNIKEHTQDGQRHLYVKDLTIAHVRRWGWHYVDELIWNHGGTPGKFVGRFKNGFEPIFHFALKPAANIRHRPEHVLIESEHAFTYEAGRRQSRTGNVGFHGTDVERSEGLALPSNVLTLRHSGGGGVDGEIEHAAMFPLRLPTWFIKAYSDPDDVIFDPFMGSGTTLIAAHQECRVAYGTEVSPAYCDVICRRYQGHTGEKPILAATGQPHDFTT